jgi:hypothetical protein
MNKLITFFLLITLFVFKGHAQEITVVIIPPPQTAYVADFFKNPNLFQIIATNTTTRDLRVKAGGKLVIDGKIIAQNPPDKSAELLLPPGVKIFNINDVFGELLKGNITLASTFESILRTGQWPSGTYEWCITVVDAATNRLYVEKCAVRFVTAYQPATLIAPQSEQVLKNPSTVIFRWSPITPAYREGAVNYVVRVFDVKAGQNSMQAFRTNFPVIDKTVISATRMLWPQEVPLEAGQYIWTAKAKS